MDWQTFVAILIVGCCAIALVRKLWGSQPEKGCGSCASGCGGKKSKQTLLIQLEKFPSKR